MKIPSAFFKPAVQIALRAFLLMAVALSCGRPEGGARKAGAQIKELAYAAVETSPTPQGKNDDSADDPAIWINKNNPDKSLIIGTDKKGGLAVYNLDGSEVKYYSAGSLNNCDLR